MRIKELESSYRKQLSDMEVSKETLLQNACKSAEIQNRSFSEHDYLLIYNEYLFTRSQAPVLFSLIDSNRDLRNTMISNVTAILLSKGIEVNTDFLNIEVLDIYDSYGFEQMSIADRVNTITNSILDDVHSDLDANVRNELHDRIFESVMNYEVSRVEMDREISQLTQQLIKRKEYATSIFDGAYFHTDKDKKLFFLNSDEAAPIREIDRKMELLDEEMICELKRLVWSNGGYVKGDHTKCGGGSRPLMGYWESPHFFCTRCRPKPE